VCKSLSPVGYSRKQSGTGLALLNTAPTRQEGTGLALLNTAPTRQEVEEAKKVFD
jgi:hypothetical protein